MPFPEKALWIDDHAPGEADFWHQLSQALPNLHLQPITTEKEFEHALLEADFDLVIIHHSLRWEDSLTILRRVKTQHPGCSVLMLSDTPDVELAVEAMKEGLDDFLVKTPQNMTRLPEAIQRALHRASRSAASREAASLRRYASRLSILRQIDQAILGAQSPEAIARATLHRVRQLIPCRQCSVAVFDLEKDQAKVFATHGSGKPALDTGTLFSPQAFGDIPPLTRGEIVYVEDIQHLASPSPWAVSLLEEGIRAYLKVPLIFQGMLMGSLNLEADQPGVFSVEHLESAREVADSLAIAIRQAKLSEQVRHLAITDELTGLFNRRHFFELGFREFERAQRYNRPLSAIMLDIDHFKQVNDRFGHVTGDQVLRAVAQRCQETLRDIDILGRYGGEEFAVLLPETDLDEGFLVAERLRLNVAGAPFSTSQETVQITISLGVARATPRVPDLQTLLEHADAAMYAAKQSGRNRAMVMER